MNNVYFDPKLLDLSVLKAKAEKKLHGVNPEETVIHYHNFGEQCGDVKHDLYMLEELDPNSTDVVKLPKFNLV